MEEKLLLLHFETRVVAKLKASFLKIEHAVSSLFMKDQVEEDFDVRWREKWNGFGWSLNEMNGV
jgi:hypothetical protein